MSTPLYLKAAARLMGVHPKTLQKWDRQGKLKACRTAFNRRYYTQEQVDAYLNPPTKETQE